MDSSEPHTAGETPLVHTSGRGQAIRLSELLALCAGDATRALCPSREGSGR